MARILLFLFCIITVPALNAQSVLWGHNLGLPHNHFISALATTPSGESITTINNRKSTMSLTGLYMGDLIIQKRDSSGAWLWEKNFAATAIIHALKIDNGGNIVIAGAYTGLLSMSNFSFTSASTVPSMFLAKLDASGNVLWVLAEENSVASNYAARLAIGNNNEIYMTMHNGNSGAFSKYTAAGTLVWSKTATGVKTFSSITVDTNDDIYLTGTCEVNARFDTISPAMSSGTYFTFLAKYNAQAQAQWVEVQVYNTFDTRDELLLHNDQLYWLHRRLLNASSTVSLTLQKFSRQGTMMAEWTPFYIPSLSTGKFMANRFLISPKGEMVLSFAATDTARIVLLDSSLVYKRQFLFTSKYIGLGQLAPLIGSYNDRVVYAGNFSGETVSFDTLNIANANTPVTENDIFVAALHLNDTASALPVSWLHFSAGVERNQAVLKWSLAAEYNNKGFEVERKVAVQDWQKIAFVNAVGNNTGITNYKYVDASVAAGTVYYRLKQIDYDGKSQYSPVANIKIKGVSTALFSVYPNPVKDKAALHFTVAETTTVELVIYNSSGIRLKALVEEIFHKGSHVKMIDCSKLAPGLYILQLVANGEASNYRLVKGS